jgi:hypothetical protein
MSPIELAAGHFAGALKNATAPRDRQLAVSLIRR